MPQSTPKGPHRPLCHPSSLPHAPAPHHANYTPPGAFYMYVAYAQTQSLRAKSAVLAVVQDISVWSGYFEYLHALRDLSCPSSVLSDGTKPQPFGPRRSAKWTLSISSISAEHSAAAAAAAALLACNVQKVTPTSCTESHRVAAPHHPALWH